VTASFVRCDYVDPPPGRPGHCRRVRTSLGSGPGFEREHLAERIVDNALRLHTLPDLGAEPIATVRPTAVQGFIKHLEAKGLSSDTIRGVFT